MNPNKPKQPRDLCSNTTVRRQVKAVRSILFPVAGANSPRLMEKRRRQILAGKLGRRDLIPTPQQLDLEKEQAPNVIPSEQ